MEGKVDGIAAHVEALEKEKRDRDSAVGENSAEKVPRSRCFTVDLRKKPLNSPYDLLSQDDPGK